MGFATYIQKLSDNDEWYTPEKAVHVIAPFIPEHVKTIWCPFDKEISQFVRIFKRGGTK